MVYTEKELVPGRAIGPNELCLHVLLELGVVLTRKTLPCSVEEHLNVGLAIDSFPWKTVTMGGKLHGLVVLVNGSEQFRMSGREITLLDRLALARTANRGQCLVTLQTVRMSHSGST